MLLGAVAIDTNWICRARRAPLASSAAKIESSAGVQRAFELSATSPPSRARDCSRIERVTFDANESMATRAATPSEMLDM